MVLDVRTVRHVRHLQALRGPAGFDVTLPGVHLGINRDRPGVRVQMRASAQYRGVGGVVLCAAKPRKAYSPAKRSRGAAGAAGE
jgi:hypothetical protein